MTFFSKALRAENKSFGSTGVKEEETALYAEQQHSLILTAFGRTALASVRQSRGDGHNSRTIFIKSQQRKAIVFSFC